MPRMMTIPAEAAQTQAAEFKRQAARLVEELRVARRALADVADKYTKASDAVVDMAATDHKDEDEQHT